MKLNKKVKWSLVVSCCFLIIVFVWMILILPENTKTSVKFKRLKSEKAKYNSEWLRYQELGNKMSGLVQGWKQPSNKPSSMAGFDVLIPINDAVTKQVTEIERIHDEEILGKLSSANRIYHEYRQQLLRDLEVQYGEKSKEAKAKLEADLASRKKRQAQDSLTFRKDLERKHQLTLVNLELQKKMLIFSPSITGNNSNQQNETERIDMEIARIRGDLKRKIANYDVELEKEFEFYQKRKTVEYQAELSELRKEKQSMIQTELSRFRDEQMAKFQAWNNQRQTEVEQAIELRRFQQ